MKSSPTVVCLDVPHWRRPSANLQGTLRAKQKPSISILHLGQLVSCVSLVALNMHCGTFSLPLQRGTRGWRFCTGSLLCCELSWWLWQNVVFGEYYSAHNRSIKKKKEERNKGRLKSSTKQASSSNPKTPKAEPKKCFRFWLKNQAAVNTAAAAADLKFNRKQNCLRWNRTKISIQGKEKPRNCIIEKKNPGLNLNEK